jgi:hypothetical protein
MKRAVPPRDLRVMQRAHGWGAREPLSPPGRLLRLPQRSVLFKTLTVSELETVLQSARLRPVHRGDTIVRQGDPPAGIFALMRGRVKLVGARPRAAT